MANDQNKGLEILYGFVADEDPRKSELNPKDLRVVIDQMYTALSRKQRKEIKNIDPAVHKLTKHLDALHDWFSAWESLEKEVVS